LTEREDIDVEESALEKARSTLRWLPTSLWQRVVRRATRMRPIHLLIAVADHFEPGILPDSPHLFAPRVEQERRLERWCREYPRIADRHRDVDGRPFRHTYFSPAEQYDAGLVSRLAEHCRDGWGEIEIHLHHGQSAPDASDNTRRTLVEFRDRLVDHGCLSQLDGTGSPRYAFVHGNWALANSGDGRFCGVDDELAILAETGCYGDFTLPSAPNAAQTRKINALYECAPPLARRAAHRHGSDLRVGSRIRQLPLIVQGPLLLALRRNGSSVWRPYIENSALSYNTPPTLARLRLWQSAAVGVRGRPDWIFVKLHCHGMDPNDEPAMFGEPAQAFLRELLALGDGVRTHFLTAREMVNVIFAACDGRDGDPGAYRDYRLGLIHAARR
jgi:hypothetical protein